MTRMAFTIATVLLLATTAIADRPPSRSLTPPAPAKSAHDLSQPLTFKQGGDTVWLQVHTNDDACTCNPAHGSECDGGPDWTETFCFEKYNPTTADSLYKYYGSPGTPFFAPSTGNGFSTADLRTYPAPDDRFYWHLDDYQAWSGNSWWCGTETGTICSDWDNAPGYGNSWDQHLVLDPDLPDVAPGDTISLECQVRYDTECEYDYAYLQYSNDGGLTWSILATFNGSSGNPVPEPCGGDYFGNGYSPLPVLPSWQLFPEMAAPEDGYMFVTNPEDFRVCFRFESDGAWSDEDGRGDTDGAFFVDNVLVHTLSFGGGILEVEDMDTNFEPEKWSLERPIGIANHWWMPFDPDPPKEPGDAGGPTVCESNVSWMWCATPFINNFWRIPPESNGFHYRLMTPRIYLGWGEPTVPFEYADAVCQHDLYASDALATCDDMDASARVYRSDKNAWCDWTRLGTWWWWDAPDDWVFDYNMRAYDMISSDVDSIQFAWDLWDNGQTGDWCWTTTYPPPHKKTRLIVDNVSFGLYDRSATQFYAREIDMFQDTFDLETAAHNALCANGDMPKILAAQESLHVDIFDLNGLSGPTSWVRLYFSTNGNTWDFNELPLRNPHPEYPDLGGTCVGSIHPSEVDIVPYPNPVWIPGTEVWYYIQVKDDHGTLAYWPSTADPANPSPPRPYYNNYLEFSVLPDAASLCDEPDRVLLVDDYGRKDYDFHPCLEDSTLWETEDFYESIIERFLEPIVCSYNKYDINGASTGLSNEPWDILLHPDPANPDSVVMPYDTVVWFSSHHNYNTVLDTMQCVLVEFVRNGGNLLICGNGIGVDMTDYGSYVDGAETCDFYGGLLGARMDPPGESAPGIVNPHVYAGGTDFIPSSGLDSDDRFHYYMGCPVNVRHDRVMINDSPPWWAPNPQPYLVFETEPTYDPGDTVVAIYNEVVDGGKVIYMCMDLSAMVDSSTVACVDGTFGGRRNIIDDVLWNIFPAPNTTGAQNETEVSGLEFVYSLSQNRPNPFNPDTQILYSVQGATRVSLRIYDVGGRLVKMLLDEMKRPGQHQVHWDGTNDHGLPVATGMYFCRMEAGEFRATRKMIMLK